MIKVKHINAQPEPDDGDRIYIDSLWSDGAFTRFVKIAEWNKDVAPSYDLWRFHFHPDRWEHFVELYKSELRQPDKEQALMQLFEKSEKGTVTLAYGNGDAGHNCALVLKDMLESLRTEAVAA